jgi:glycosyltransferase involved in cell wall biosynthesis
MVGDAQSRFQYADEVGVAMAEKGIATVALMAGHVDDMPAAYAASDIVVSASTDPEAFGRVAAEAGAMAKPVVATDHGGARETVIANVSGVLVPPGDAAALADALSNLLARPAHDLVVMGNAARAHIRAHYTVERMCEATLMLYARVLGDRVEGD